MRYLFILSFLASCSSASMDDLRKEGEAQTHKLASDLRKVETKEDLQKILPKLKKKFNQLGDLLIQVRKIKEKGPSEPSVAGEELFGELARLYEVPGCRDLIETAQREAVHRLDQVR